MSGNTGRVPAPHLHTYHLRARGAISQCPLARARVRAVARVAKFVPREMQREAVEFCIAALTGGVERDGSRRRPLDGVLIADDMGTGKTATAVLVAAELARQTQKPRTLFLVPLAVVQSWAGTIRWVCPGQDVRVARDGARREEAVGEFMCGTHWLVMTYRAFVHAMDELLFAARLDGAEIGCVVCDEAHVLKNDSSAVHGAVRRLRADKRLLLSATPSSGRLLDLHVLIDLMHPGAAGGVAAFKLVILDPIQRHLESSGDTLTEEALVAELPTF